MSIIDEILNKPTSEDFMTIIRLRDARIVELETQLKQVLKQQKPCNHTYRNVTGKPWLKCMNCGEVIDE